MQLYSTGDAARMLRVTRDSLHAALRTTAPDAKGPAQPTAINLGGFADGDLITKRELGKCLGCSERTLQRMVERFELPPPMTLGGRKVWIVGKIRAWLIDATERREAEALKEARRLRVLDA